MKKNSIAVLLLGYEQFSVTFSFIPASADSDDDANFLKSLLDQSRDQVNNKMSELEDAGTPVPFYVGFFNNRGQIGYEAALASIEDGNLDEAQEHAFAAMSFFEGALEGLFETEDFGGQVDDNTDKINELVDAISNSESDADEIRDLALQNDLDISFSDYDDAIEDAKALLAEGDLEGATEQFEIAEDLLEDVFDQIDEAVDLQQDDRVDEFVTSTILQLEGIIEGAIGLGITQSFIDELQKTVNIIKNAESSDEIRDVTGPSSDLNILISELTPVGPPDGVPGQGPPDGIPGQGPPDGIPGQGPPDGVPGLEDEDVSSFDEGNSDDDPHGNPHENPHDNPDSDIESERAGGPPEGKGKPEGKGRPPGKGKPADVGPPEGKGPPDDPGPPGDPGPP